MKTITFFWVCSKILSEIIYMVVEMVFSTENIDGLEAKKNKTLTIKK